MKKIIGSQRIYKIEDIPNISYYGAEHWKYVFEEEQKTIKEAPICNILLHQGYHRRMRQRKTQDICCINKKKDCRVCDIYKLNKFCHYTKK